VNKPADEVHLSADESERLIAHVHHSNLPAAVAGRLEQIIRTCFWLVVALQETKMTLRRLRRVLCGTALPPHRRRRTPQPRLQLVTMSIAVVWASKPMAGNVLDLLSLLENCVTFHMQHECYRLFYAKKWLEPRIFSW
jgi:hypothetical protein